MKQLLIAITLAFGLVVSASAQTFDHFTYSNGDLAGNGSWVTVSGMDTATAGWDVSSNAITPRNIKGATHYGAAAYNVSQSSFDSIKVGVKVATKTTSNSPVANVWIYLMGTKDLAGSGIRCGYTYWTSTQTRVDIDKITAGVVEHDREYYTTTFNFAANDTFYATVTPGTGSNKIVKLYHNSDSLTSITFGSGVPASGYVILSGSVYNTALKIDDFSIGKITASTPASTPPTAVSYSAAPSSGWTTSTTGNFIISATDDSSLKKIVFNLNGTDQDSVLYNPGVLSASWSTKNFTFGTAGTQSWYYKLTDSAALNVTTTPTQSLVVGSGSSGGTGLRHVCVYYPEFGDISPTPAQIDWNAFNEIVLFTLEPTQTAPNYFRELPGTTDSANFDGGYNKRIYWSKAVVDSAHAHGVKVLFSLGGEVGGNATNFTFLLQDTTKLKAFIDYATGWVSRRNADGFVFDHEFTAASDSVNLRFGYRYARKKLDAYKSGCIITTDVPVWQLGAYTGNGALATFYNTDTVNYISIMQYGQADGSTVVGHNSPLFQSSCAGYNGGSWFANPYGQGPYAGWISKGINASHVMVIFPFECKKYGSNTAICQTKNGGPGLANYSEAVPYLANTVWDATAKAASVSNGTSLWSIENQASIQAKVDTLRKGGFAGVGVWELFRGYAANANPPDQLLQFLKASVNNTYSPPAIPAAPTLSTPANAATGQTTTLSFTWNAVTGADTYTLTVATDTNLSAFGGGSPVVVSNIAGVTSQIGQRLSNATKYFWAVSATNVAGTSAKSPVWSFTTASIVVITPAVPTLTSPANAATGVAVSPALIWNRVVVDATLNTYASFNLQISQDSTFVGTAAPVLPYAISDSTYTVNGLQYGTTYYWRVQSVNGASTSAYSSFRSFTTLTVVATPVGQTAFLVTNNGGKNGLSTTPLGFFTSICNGNYASIPKAAVAGYKNISDDGRYSIDANGNPSRVLTTSDEPVIHAAANAILMGMSNGIAGQTPLSTDFVLRPLSTGQNVLYVNHSNTADTATYARASGSLPTRKSIQDSLHGLGQAIDTVLNTITFRDTGFGRVISINPGNGVATLTTWSGATFSLFDNGTGKSYNFVGGKFKTVSGQTAQSPYTWPIIVDTVLRGVQGAAITAVNMDSARVSGTYIAHYYITTTTAGTAGSIRVKFKWNDGAAAQADSSSDVVVSTLGNYTQGSKIIVNGNNTNPTWETVVGTSFTGSPKYELHLWVSRIY